MCVQTAGAATAVDSGSDGAARRLGVLARPVKTDDLLDEVKSLPSPSSTSPARSKILAVVLSGIFPGLGQFYNRQPIKGAAFVIIGGVLTWLLGRALPDPLALLTAPIGTNLTVLLCLLLALWGWSLIDAWWTSGR